jgi:fermentation-respiration switch protein FrsA (DUF1100 family)
MRLAAAAVLVLAIVVALVWTLQRRMIYFPSSDVRLPAATGAVRIEPVRFSTADGIELDAWFVPVRGAARPATVVVFNGNAGNRSHRVDLAAALHRHGLQVLLVDYRGYGGNPGEPGERGLAADSRAARAYVASRPDVDAARLVYFGESLGAAVAIDLATEHPPAALVLRSPFTSMVDVARYHYPILPVRLLLRDRYPSLERIARIHSPVLVIAGDRDGIVPDRQSRQVYEAAPGRKSLLIVAGANHNDFELLAGDATIDAVVRFVASTAAGA